MIRGLIAVLAIAAGIGVFMSLILNPIYGLFAFGFSAFVGLLIRRFVTLLLRYGNTLIKNR